MADTQVAAVVALLLMGGILTIAVVAAIQFAIDRWHIRRRGIETKKLPVMYCTHSLSHKHKLRLNEVERGSLYKIHWFYCIFCRERIGFYSSQNVKEYLFDVPKETSTASARSTGEDA